ncbi:MULTISPECIES: GNAT family N-acetyltransferase [Hyphomicrobiales]|jgi:GNAT superfamily N-acetyltransferase|uniref:GNAT family N-acetyltransferase n=1 Tax=Hyphomicrobiales TaxID=356 RepID=UPI000646C2D9|nr:MULTISPECIES: GNAT family N-acetyltransferase [Hyphomicrobiales]RKD74102.1 acetyltransferase (GNAT) family protein [Rhizobium sp. WW_1]RZS83902.1 acetyltransferase (GNAT) family protein [Phyllobacterium myrsinacearum]
MDYQIDVADDVRMAEIEAWLDAEQVAYDIAARKWNESDWQEPHPVEGFRCNWDSVKRAWQEGSSTIHVLIVNDAAVGFLDGTNILEIRPDVRDKGYGRILAGFMEGCARAEGRSVLEIEIAPRSAKPFWKRMGFIPVEESRVVNGLYAFKVLQRNFALGRGDRVPYSISFFEQEERFKENPTPLSEHVGEGERLPDGTIQLPERVFCFNPLNPRYIDYFVKVEVHGAEILYDKAKYPESKKIGVECDLGGIFFIERIDL